MSIVTGIKYLLKSSGKAVSHAVQTTAKAAAPASRNFATVTDELAHGAAKTVVQETIAGAKKVAKNVTMNAEEFALRRTKLVETFGKSGKIEEETAGYILESVKPENIEVFERFAQNADIEPKKLQYVHQLVYPENEEVVVDLLKDKAVDIRKFGQIDKAEWVNKTNAKLLKRLSTVENFEAQDMRYIVQSVKQPEDVDAMYKLLSHNGVKVKGEEIGQVSEIFYRTDKYGDNIVSVRKLINDVTKHKEFKVNSLADFSDILKEVNKDNLKFAKKICLSQKPIPIATSTSMLREFNPESEKFLNELLEILPENYSYKLPFGLNYKVANKYISFIKSLNLKSEKDIIAVLETLEHITNEKELAIVMKLMRENPSNIRQIADNIIINHTCLRNADEFSEIIAKSGRDLSPEQLKELSMYYGCIKQDESRQVINRLLADKNIKLEDVSRIQYELLNSRTSQVFNAERRAKFLNRLLDKGLPWDDVQRIYNSANNEQKVALIERFIDNPKFLKCDIAQIPVGSEAEIERLLQNDIFKPENYHKYIEAINRGEQVASKAGEAKWKQLESLLKKYPNDEISCIKLTSVTNKTNKKLVTTMLRRKFSLDEIVRAVEPWYVAGRTPARLTATEVEFLSRLYADKQLTKEGLKLLVHHEPKDIYKIMQKYPTQAKQALNAGIDIKGMDALLKNKNFDYILAQIRDIEKTHNIKIEYPISIPYEYGGNANDLFLTVKINNNTILKFDKHSGRLLTVSQDKLCLNVKNGVKSSAVSYNGSRLEGQWGGDVTSPYYMETYLERPGQAPVRTIYKESSVPGQYEIATQTPDGRKTTIGIARTMPSGKQYIQRTLKSLDGHTTEYKFRSTPEGDRFLSSTIKDKNGKVISSTRRTFKQLSDTHFISSVNGKSYDIEYMSDKVVATKLDEAGKKTAQTVEYAIVDMPENTAQMMMEEFEAEAKFLTEQMRRAGIKGSPNPDTIQKLWQKIFKRHGISPYSIDRKALGIMKQLPGDEWFAMKESCHYVVGSNIQANNACFAGSPIFMSEELINNFGVFTHELGHAKFQALGLVDDAELMKIYNSEKRLFTQTFPETNIDSIDYFLKGNAIEKRGVNEGAAEICLIDNTPQSFDLIQDRTILWEQYFPQTSAYIKSKYRLFG